MPLHDTYITISDLSPLGTGLIHIFGDNREDNRVGEGLLSNSRPEFSCAASDAVSIGSADGDGDGRDRAAEVPDGSAATDTTAALKRLRRDNEILRQERDILKRATAFFARQGSR